jgi:hypothetical protein
MQPTRALYSTLTVHCYTMSGAAASPAGPLLGQGETRQYGLLTHVNPPGQGKHPCLESTLASAVPRRRCVDRVPERGSVTGVAAGVW